MVVEDSSFIPATFGQRVVSRLIDTFIISLIATILGFILQQNGNLEDESLVGGIGFVLYFFVYYPLFEVSGATVGKEVMKLKTLSTKTFEKITLLQAYHRSIILCWPIFVFVLGFMVSDWGGGMMTLTIAPFLLLLFTTLPPLAMLWRKDKRGYHDYWADVIVVKK